MIKSVPDDTPVPRANNETDDRFRQYSIGQQYQSSFGSEVHKSEWMDLIVLWSKNLQPVALHRNLFSVQHIW